MKKIKLNARIVEQNFNLKIDYCSFEAAKYAVIHWHYSKTIQQGKSFRLGIWENNIFKGCIIFSQGNNPDLGIKYNLDKYEICELSRIALNNHLASVSKLISVSINRLKKDIPRLKLIISFADSNQNHLGIIYQASNFVYTGQTTASKLYLAPNGKIYHTRSISGSGYVKQFQKKVRCYKPSECKIIMQKPKYRYLYPLTKEIRKQVLKLAKPYPKSLCGGSSKSEQLITNEKVGGVLPTPPLHLIKECNGI